MAGAICWVVTGCVLPLQLHCSWEIFGVVKLSLCHKWDLDRACCAWTWKKWNKKPCAIWPERGLGGCQVAAKQEPWLNISPSGRWVMEIPPGIRSFILYPFPVGAQAGEHSMKGVIKKLLGLTQFLSSGPLPPAILDYVLRERCSVSPAW